VNEQIRVSELMVIGPNGEQMGIKSLQDALTIANFAGLDLVLMNGSSTPAVGKIMDYNKFRYEKKKKAKDALKKQKATQSELKEFRLSPVIDVGDFETKLKNATKYIVKGDRVKLSIRFKGRQMAHTEIGRDVLLKFAKRLEEYADIQDAPKLDGRQMTMLLVPSKNKEK
jgi:translation initiation factor IF-3